jgi:hypothetical protein
VAQYRGRRTGDPAGGDQPPAVGRLRENQLDQDSLPAYDVLDGILYRYIDQEQSRTEIVAAGYDAAVVDRVLRWCASASGSGTRPRRGRRSRAGRSAASVATRSATATRAEAAVGG